MSLLFSIVILIVLFAELIEGQRDRPRSHLPDDPFSGDVDIPILDFWADDDWDDDFID